MRYGAKTEPAGRPPDPNLRSLSSPQAFETSEGRHLLCQFAIRKTQPMRSRMHSHSSKFDKSMKSRNSAASFSRALIALAVFSIGGPLLAQSSDWKAPPAAANRPNPVPANANTIALGQKLFVANCVTCHGATEKMRFYLPCEKMHSFS